MKLESLVIADQNAAVNTFPGLVHTARHITKVGCTRSGRANREEGGDDVRSAWPLRLGLHTCYNGRYREQPLGDQERIYKTGHSSDRSLQLDSVKLESLVIGYQP